jgi:hypothetical protein
MKFKNIATDKNRLIIKLCELCELELENSNKRF